MRVVMRKIIRSGAKLAVPEATIVPEIFELEIAGETVRRQCRTMRRGQRDIGVRFVA